MTNPRAETLEREKEKLWVTDAELIRRVGCAGESYEKHAAGVGKQDGLPAKGPPVRRAAAISAGRCRLFRSLLRFQSGRPKRE